MATFYAGQPDYISVLNSMAPYTSTKGTFVVGDGVGNPISVIPGTDGWVLSSDSTQAAGLKWVALAGGGDMVLNTNQVVTALKTFNTNMFALGGTFSTILNGSATGSAKTITFPNATGTVVLSGSATTSGITMSTAKLLGRSTAATGAIEEIILGTNLYFTGTTLNATGAGGSITITESNTATTYYPVFYNTTGSMTNAYIDNTTTPLSYVPSTSTLTASTFVGSLIGNASTVTTNANLTGVVTSIGNTTAIATGAIINSMLANSAVANLSNTNSGDNATNTQYSNDYRAANFVAGSQYVAPGSATTSGITMSTAKLLGRSTADTGAIEEIILGTNLSFTGNTLNAAGAGGATDIAEGTRTSTSVIITSSTGTDATLSAASSTLAGILTASDKNKLDNTYTSTQVDTIISNLSNNSFIEGGNASSIYTANQSTDGGTA